MDTDRKFGTVIVRDHYWIGPDGTEYAGITGFIDPIAVSEYLGFDVTSRDANWMLDITGPTNMVRLPGCGVLGAIYHEPGTLEGEAYYKVD